MKYFEHPPDDADHILLDAKGSLNIQDCRVIIDERPGQPEFCFTINAPGRTLNVFEFLLFLPNKYLSIVYVVVVGMN